MFEVRRDETTSPLVYRAFKQLLGDSEALHRDRSVAILEYIRRAKLEIIDYLGVIKSAFSEFVSRPDAKQDYLEAWHLEFNQTEVDLRFDLEVQADLHQRLSDLISSLNEITEQRQKESEEERKEIMTSDWLHDQIKLLVGHFSELMKQEIMLSSSNSACTRRHFAYQANLEQDRLSAIFR